MDDIVFAVAIVLVMVSAFIAGAAFEGERVRKRRISESREET